MLQCAFKKKIITAELFCTKLFAFRKELYGPARTSWLPLRKPPQFTNMVPGTMSQVEVFIQYLPLLLYKELTKESATGFLQSREWKLYLYEKRFFSFVLADRLSERQVRQLEKLILDMLDLRIKLNAKRDGRKLIMPYEFSWITPKHVFLLQYPKIIRHSGTLKQYSTIRKESKNGELKRQAQIGKNKKNHLASLLNSENKLQAASSYDGKYCEMHLTIVEPCQEPDVSVSQYIEGVWGNRCSFTHANRICFKGVEYTNRNHHAVLVYVDGKQDFSFGVIRQLLTMSDGEPTIVFEETDKKLVAELGVYEVEMKGQLGHAKITDLAHYNPRYLYETRNKFLMTLSCMPYLT